MYAKRWKLASGTLNELLNELSQIASDLKKLCFIIRGGSRTAAKSKMEHFLIIVNGWKSLTISTKCSFLDVAAVLDPPLFTIPLRSMSYQ